MTPAPAPSLLMLGEGWFPDTASGSARVVRELHQSLGPLLAVDTIVVGPASEPLDGVHVAAQAGDSLIRRLRAFSAAAAERARPADVVETHFALYAALPLLTGKFRRNAFVAHVHGPWAGESKATGDDVVRVHVKKAIERLVYRRASQVIVHSFAFKRLLVEEYGIRPWDVHVVPPGVDLELFSPGDRLQARERLGIPAESKVIASVRRLVPRMGLGVLLEACALLDGEPLVLIGGDGPERGRLEAKAEELGIGRQVRFLGRLSDEAVRDVYRAADVCVVPSIALEGFGLVVLEALACGTPVIASDLGGLAEALGELAPSLVVPPGDAGRLARRLEHSLMRRHDLPDRTTCRGQAERFSWRASAARHVDVYRRAQRAGVGRAQTAAPRVVFLDHCARLSGAELALVRLLRALGHAVDAHVVLGEDGPLTTKLRLAGVSTEVMELSRSVRETRRDRVAVGRLSARDSAQAARYVIRLARRLRRLRPDLVHTNSLKALLYGGLAGRLAGVPVVWHVHDRIADDYLPASAVRLVGSLARFVPSAVIANSHETLARLHEASNGATRAIPNAVVYYPVDLRPQARHHNGGPLRVGMLGRIAPWKGQDVFLRAFAHAFADGDERAAIVGAPLFGEDSYDDSLRQLVRELGIEKRVEFAGFQDDIAGQLARLDVLVHASRVPEPLGQVVQEGMRVGLPVVAARAGGPAEVIADGETGFLYPAGDAGALAGTLETLAADPTLRARVGAAAVTRARAFDPERIAPQVLDLYRTVLER
jgi:glycosyltransferase involved in cell wall biosynthesis